MRKTILMLLKTLLVLIMVVPLSEKTMASIHTAYGFNGVCGLGGTNESTDSLTKHLELVCILSSSSYVPHSGNYKVRTKVFINHALTTTVNTTAGYLDESKTITEQDVYVTGANGNSVAVTVPGKGVYGGCQLLVDESGKEYFVEGNDELCYGVTPLPPTPPIPQTSCSINNGNILTVELENVERANLPTTPGAGAEIKHVPVPVTCTGGVNVPVKMQLNYTPISIGSTQVVKSSSEGLGVAIIYNDNPLASTDITPITFLSGANTFDLGFQAVRNPDVAIANVPTGAFTANATLIMTQQ